MRIIVPYVGGMLQPATFNALTGYGRQVEYVELDRDDPYGYALLVRDLWQQDGDWAICEQDVVPP